jgi:hypothetical protein
MWKFLPNCLRDSQILRTNFQQKTPKTPSLGEGEERGGEGEEWGGDGEEGGKGRGSYGVRP